MANDLNGVAEWLAALGRPVPPTRIGEYQRQLTRAAVAFEAGTIERMLRESGTAGLTNAIFEAIELRRIYRKFRTHESSELRRRLMDFVKGPPVAIDELVSSSSNRARDIGFELGLAARLWTSDLQPELHPEGDLRLRHAGHEVFVECKRPQRAQQVSGRIAEALRQLETRYAQADDPACARGVVALSVTKLLNPSALVLSVPSGGALFALLDRALAQFAESYAHDLANRSDLRTLGLLVEVQAVAVLAPDGPISAGSHLVMAADSLVQEKDLALLRSVSYSLEQALTMEQG